MNAKDVCDRAAALVAHGRRAEHGDAAANHAAIAAVWQGILAAAGKAPAVALDAHDVANLMEGLKIARRYGGLFNPDDYVDGAGYAAVAGEIRAGLERAAPPAKRRRR